MRYTEGLMRRSVAAGLAFLVLLIGGLSLDAAAQVENYRLGPDDKIRVTVFGEPYLSGEFNVNANGTVSLPLVGPVVVKGLTLADAETAIKGALADGFMDDPKVSIDILGYRPFFIIGEVNNPGRYPYMADMTVLHAVATAGGFTPRAAKKKIFIQRDANQAMPVQSNTPVKPGDVITVEERWF